MDDVRFFGPAKRRSRRLRTLLIACLLLPLTAAAEEGRLYAVELIVFSRDSGNFEEIWPDQLALRYPDRARRLAQPGPDGADPATSRPPLWTSLGSGELRLRDTARALERQADTRVLFHDRWVQPAQWQGRPAPIVVTGGREVGGHYELEGYVTLRVSRFLHLQTHLWLSEFTGADATPAIIEEETPFRLPELPPRHAPTAAVSTRTLLEGENGEIEPAAAPLESAPFEAQPVIPQQVIPLQQQRRVRFGELHYIDHPRLGALVQVTEFKPEPATTEEAPAQAAVR